MGTATWDKRFISDVALSYSKVKWEDKKQLFVVHRDFDIPSAACTVAQIVAALGDATAFRDTIPRFLWDLAGPQTEPPAPGARGLWELAALIQHGDLTGTGHFWHWRFGINHLRSSASDETNCFFEVRLIFDSTHIGLSRDLGEDDTTPGNNAGSSRFHAALTHLHHAKNRDFLLSVFPPS